MLKRINLIPWGDGWILSARVEGRLHIFGALPQTFDNALELRTGFRSKEIPYNKTEWMAYADYAKVGPHKFEETV